MELSVQEVVILRAILVDPKRLQITSTPAALSGPSHKRVFIYTYNTSLNISREVLYVYIFFLYIFFVFHLLYYHFLFLNNESFHSYFSI